MEDSTGENKSVKQEAGEPMSIKVKDQNGGEVRRRRLPPPAALPHLSSIGARSRVLHPLLPPLAQP